MMKPLLFLIFICNFASAQKMPSDYFDEAQKYYEQGKREAALTAFKYIVDHYPKNELYPRAFYNIGYIYFEEKDYDSAVRIFRKILNSNFNEREALGGSIMSDPYANYKHRATELLSKIYYTENKFDTALLYLALSDTTYPYLHFCGNEYAENSVYTALEYADIFEKLNQNDKAIQSLLPTVFITLADNSKVISELSKLFARKPNIKISLDEAVDKIYSKSDINGADTVVTYYFKFYNTEIPVPNNSDKKKDASQLAKTKQEIKETAFYKMVKKL